MDDMQAIEQRITRELHRRAGPSEPVDDAAIFTAITATTSPKSRFWAMFSATKFVASAVVVVLFGGLLLVAQYSDRVAVTVPGADGLPPVTGPAGNGLIAFERDGDIYLSDPVTGVSEAIVAGPEYDTSPRFSPDGTHIAFRRVHALDEARDSAIENADADWVVVRADGSDERVLTPTHGLWRSCCDFVWSPDGRAIVVTQAIGYGPRTALFLVDATGAADPRPLGSPGAAPWGFGGDQVAWFLRPPASDRVMAPSEDPIRLTVTDLDGSDVLDLGALSGLDAMGYTWVGSSAWSPDASRILVMAGTDEDEHLYVMDEDGSDLRLLSEAGGGGAWSPDGSTIASLQEMAIEPGSTDDGQADQCPSAVITIIDVETGSDRDLQATRLADPDVADPTDDCPDIRGWQWSPDGRTILMHWWEPRTRPLLLDVETGEVTELPWESDSAPSWQRVAAD